MIAPLASAQKTFKIIAANIETVMHGQGPAIRKLLTAFASGGHVLLDAVFLVADDVDDAVLRAQFRR